MAVNCNQKTIDDFLGQESFAVVGVSRTGKKFGNTVFNMLRSKGLTVYPVNRGAKTIEGIACYARLRDLPKRVDGVVAVVPPAETELLVKEAAELGIRRIWMQQGSESTKAIQFCEQYGMKAVHGRCIMMFSEPVLSMHKFHKWALKLLGKLPCDAENSKSMKS